MSINKIPKGTASHREVELPYWYDDPVNVIALAALVILGTVLISGAAKQLMESRIGKGAAGLLVISVAIQVLRGMHEEAASINPLNGANRAEQIRWALDQLREHIEKATLFGDGAFSVKFKIEDGRERKKFYLQWKTVRISRELKGTIDFDTGGVTFTEGWMKASFCNVYTTVHGISLTEKGAVFNNTFLWIPYSWSFYELPENKNTPQDLSAGCRGEKDGFQLVEAQ